MSEQTTGKKFAPLDFSDFRSRVPAMEVGSEPFDEITKMLEAWSEGLIRNLAHDWDEREAELVLMDKKLSVLRSYVELDAQIVGAFIEIIKQRAEIANRIEALYPELFEAQNGRTEKKTDEATATKTNNAATSV